MKFTKMIALCLTLALLLTAVLTGCGKNPEQPSTGSPSTAAQSEEAGESETKDERPKADRPAFAMVEWTKYQVRSDDLEFLGKPASEVTLRDVLDKYPEGSAALTGNSFTDVNKDNFFEIEDTLLLVKPNRELYFFSSDDIDLRGGYSERAVVFFPMQAENVRMCDAVNGDCWAFSVQQASSSRELLQCIGIEDIPRVNDEDSNPYSYYEMLTSFLEKHGAPTGLVYDNDWGGFFDPEGGNPWAGTKYNTDYILYWERENYVITLNIDEKVDDKGNWVSNLGGSAEFFTKQAWDNTLEARLNPSSPFDDGYTLVLFENFGELIDKANALADLPKD